MNGRGVAVVTGASRGLGAAVAVALAERGHELVLIGRDEEALRGVAARAGGGVRILAVDLGDTGALSAALEREAAALGRCEVLVNAAARAQAMPFTTTGVAEMRRAVETNAIAPMALAAEVLPGMLERRRGCILNVVTGGARCALPLFSAYSASKGALWSWSESLGRELAGSGVRVATFVPPHMRTDTQARLSAEAASWYGESAEGGRTSAPDDVAKAVLRALGGGPRLVAPLGVRVKVALDVLVPGLVDRGSRRKV